MPIKAALGAHVALATTPHIIHEILAVVAVHVLAILVVISNPW